MRYSVACVVVCLPESSASEISRVRALASGIRLLTSVDLPMPDWPTRTLVCLASRRGRSGSTLVFAQRCKAGITEPGKSG